MKILLVEDNKTHREHIKKLLGSHYVFEVAESAEEALRIWKQSRDELYAALVDLHLTPSLKMEGFELIRKIRRLELEVVSGEKRRRLPILVLTVRREDELLPEAITCGADDFISKPLKADIVLARLEARIRVGMPSDLKHGPFTLDIYRGEVHVSDDAVVILTQKEFLFLKFLMMTRCKTKTKELVNQIWEPHELEKLKSPENGVHNLATRLRIKLQEKLQGPQKKLDPILSDSMGYSLQNYPGA